MIRLAPLLLLVATTGCIFRDAEAPRFYRPASATLDATVARTPAARGVPIRLRPVRGTPFLRERVVWQSSLSEYGVYEQRLWRELPARYVERALATELGRTPGLRLTDDAQAASLSVEITAFDEVLAPAYAARIVAVVLLRDVAGQRLVDRAFVVEEAGTGVPSAALPVAMGAALDRLVAEVAQAVTAALPQRGAQSRPRSDRTKPADMHDR